MKKVLIVDDSAPNRKLLRKVLSKININNIIEAQNGEEAVSLFEQNQPDLVLMDINMPVMNGFEAARSIKDMTGQMYVPIIFVTAQNDEGTLAKAIVSGGDDYVSKPIDIEVLKSKMHAHLRIRELYLELHDRNLELDKFNQTLLNERELIDYFFESAIENSDIEKGIIDYHMSPSSTFNGDIFLVKRGPFGSLNIILGDFTGHGLTAAMGTLPTAMIFFKMVRGGFSISDIARELNSQLYKLLPSSIFLAATLIEYNCKTRVLSVWQGGMPDSYLTNGQGALKNEVRSMHMPLGIVADKEFDSATQHFNVETGDKLYIYSDGVIESRNPQGEIFGNERLKNILLHNTSDCVAEVIKELEEFTHSEEQADDTTFVELLCNDLIPEDKPVKANDGYFTEASISLTINEDDIRNRDPVTNISEILASIPYLSSYKGLIQILLSEVYMNIVDHSILNLESSAKDNRQDFEEYYIERQKKLEKLSGVRIDFVIALYSQQENKYMKLTVTDNGSGYSGHKKVTTENLLYGRGLEIIDNLCESLEFSNEGRTLEIVYKFS